MKRIWSLVYLTIATIIAPSIEAVHKNVAHQNNNGGDTLKLVVLIHRHGDRTPISTYPRDPYRNSSYWPDGWGQLTLRGKERMYKLGLYLAKRYANFLTTSPLEAYARSSGSDRCLESVSLILAALYPPISRWRWNQDLGSKWQPFPIQTVVHDYDSLLNPDSYCKKGKQEIDKIYNSVQVQKYTEQPILQYVQDNTGYDSMDLIRAEEVFDSLLVEKENNYKLPTWVDNTSYSQLRAIADKTFVFSALTHEIQRLRAGLLIKEIVEIMSKPDLGGKRLYIYSTHDTQLSVFLSALNVYNQLAPPFGATIMLEMYQNQTNQPYIKMFYLNVTDSESPHELVLKQCLQYSSETSSEHHLSSSSSSSSSMCSVTNFHQMVSDLIPDNWEEECGNTTAVNDDVISVYILATTLFITICVLMVFIYLFLNNRRHATLYKMLPVNY